MKSYFNARSYIAELYARNYIAELNAHVEAQRAQDTVKQAAKAAAERDLASLDGKLKRLLATIPAEVQAEGLSILSLQVLLRPRGSERSCCTTGQLGDALRRHGFVRERAWRDGRAGFRALWRKRQTGVQASPPQASEGPGHPANPLARPIPPSPEFEYAAEPRLTLIHVAAAACGAN